jgi:hypothetical protein
LYWQRSFFLGASLLHTLELTGQNPWSFTQASIGSRAFRFGSDSDLAVNGIISHTASTLVVTANIVMVDAIEKQSSS